MMLVTTEWSEGKLLKTGMPVRIQSANGGLQVRIFNTKEEFVHTIPLLQKEVELSIEQLERPCWVSFKTIAGETHVHLEQS